MNKKIFFIGLLAIAAMGCYHLQENLTQKISVNLTLSNLEALTACESIGWWDNDGNCVKNDAGVYFCKSDSWPALTDCIQ